MAAGRGRGVKFACVSLWCLHVCTGNGNTTRRKGEEEMYKKKLVEMFGILRSDLRMDLSQTENN